MSVELFTACNLGTVAKDICDAQATMSLQQGWMFIVGIVACFITGYITAKSK